MVTTRLPVFNPAISPKMFFFEIQHIRIIKVIESASMKDQTNCRLETWIDF